MISVEQAISKVLNNTHATQAHELKNLNKTLGDVLFEDILSPINMPPFRQSAMDGYALNLHNNKTYSIIGEVKAGDKHHPKLNSGEAVRIFTGAPVPETANAVVMQELTQTKDDCLTIERAISVNDNIRPLGEQVMQGQIALIQGTRLNPAAIAFLISLGITQVKVYKKPSIAVVATGNELVKAGQPLAYGQIYESNAAMLTSVLKQLFFEDVSKHKIDDNYNDTLSLLGQIINDHEVILISGGISVGDYDFVGKALIELGVDELFYKVNQKPGKPLFFGKKENKVIFALPGNPAAALSCFYVYVFPALQNLIGLKHQSLARTTAVSQSNFNIKGDRAQFLKAIYHNGEVTILDGQNSSMLHTFALANALVYVRPGSSSIKINDNVEVILLP